MIKQEDFINNRVDYKFGNKKVTIVESHNFVLPVWAEYCSEHKNEYRLITIDYHMDTRPIFSQYAYKVSNGDIAKVNEYSIQRKIYNKYIMHKYDSNMIEEMTRKYVYHDEHILVGYNMGYLSDFFCICKDKQDFSESYKHYFVIGLDSEINTFYNEAMKEKYILDIDLDFFNSNKDYDENREMLMNLIKNTDIITIAREHSYFDYLRDNTKWTNDIALMEIINLIKEVTYD